MVRLLDSDVKTGEVLDWKGVHLLHAPGSSCSQKTRIFLNLKNIPWQSHVIDLAKGENLEPWYLGINPRGLVPCLVHDGAVFIESNDIIEYLEDTFPDPSLVPPESRDRVHDLLGMEDALHEDLRVLTFRYLIAKPPGQVKSRAALEQLRSHDGTIGGRPDPQKDREIGFWEDANEYGITDEQVTTAVDHFRSALNEIEVVLAGSEYILGKEISVVDIAWYVYAARLIAAGYPLTRLHGSVGKWFDKLDSLPEFHREVETPPGLLAARETLQQAQREQGQSLESVAGL
jgi:glutathione S-transferase